MADQSTGRPAFLASIATDDPHKALQVLERQHPDYAAHATSWQIQLDAYEGTGGFLNGSYLFEYPREDAEAFTARKQMARYHNYLESLNDLYVRFIWTHGVTRTSDNEEYNAWLEMVDGENQTIDDLLKRLAAVALVHGHAAVMVDKTADAPMGDSKADETARVIASVFSALSITDWRFDQSGLSAVKLLEAPVPVDIATEEPTGKDAVQYLLWALDGWARFDAKGELLGWDMPNLGLVPLVVMRPKPAYLSPMLGRALIGNANVLRAMFNRDSEEDEVLRAQAFSVLTVEVAQDGDVEETRAALGQTIGAAKALVVKGAIKYETPDQNVPKAIRENKAYLVQELYRAAHVRYQRDGLQRESGDAIALQYTELNEMLQGFSKALASAEKDIARAWFAWMFPTPEAAQAAYEAANIVVKYPDKFFLAPLIEDLEAWAEGIRLNLGETANKTIKKRAARRILPDLSAEEFETIDQEIDALKDDDTMLVGKSVDLGDPEASEIERAAVN